MELNRADVERIVRLVITNLKIEVKNEFWIDPNTRIICLKLGDEIISETEFNVVQQPK